MGRDPVSLGKTICGAVARAARREAARARKIEAPQEDPVSVGNAMCGAVARAARREAARAGNEGEADATTGLLRAEKSAEPGPERPATQWQDRETKAKRMRPLGFYEQRSLLSRGPSGPPRSGKSGKEQQLHFCRDDRSPIGARSQEALVTADRS
jgi:hypothetical protein